MIAAIAAIDENWGIGYNGKLLEHIPEDLKYFRELTINKTVVMGKNTWLSLPKHPLKDRQNIILSKTLYQKGWPEFMPNCLWLPDKEFLNDWLFAEETEQYDKFIIGGEQLYKEYLPYYEKIYLTKIFKSHDNVDAYFPQLNENEWQGSPVSEVKQYNDISYQFWEYNRIS